MGEEGRDGEKEEGNRERDKRERKWEGGEGGRTYLDKPANKVTRYKHIHLVHYVCKGAIGVARSIDAAVLGIGALW